MDNYGIRIDLKKFRNAGLATIAGRTGKKKCIVISVEPEDNPEIFVGEKCVYLSLVAFTKRETGKNGETHIIKGSIPKDVREAMSEEERRAQPIFGDMKPVERRSYVPGQPAPEVAAEPADDDDDLPW